LSGVAPEGRQQLYLALKSCKETTKNCKREPLEVKIEHFKAEREAEGWVGVSVGHGMQRAGGNKRRGTFFRSLNADNFFQLKKNKADAALRKKGRNVR
jgi:hypothetical protein